MHTLFSSLDCSLPPSAAEPDPQPKSEENEPTVIPLYEVSLSWSALVVPNYVRMFTAIEHAGC